MRNASFKIRSLRPGLHHTTRISGRTSSISRRTKNRSHGLNSSGNVSRYTPIVEPVIIGGFSILNTYGGREGALLNILKMLDSVKSNEAILDSLRRREMIRYEGDGRWLERASNTIWTKDEVLRFYTPKVFDGLGIRPLDFATCSDMPPLEYFLLEKPIIKDIATSRLLDPLPEGQKILGEGSQPGTKRVEISKVYLPVNRPPKVSFGGAIPDGILLDAEGIKATVSHLYRMVLYTGCEVFLDMGIPFETILNTFGARRIGSYYGTAMSDTGPSGSGGYMYDYFVGGGCKTTFKMALSLGGTPAGFFNSHVLGPKGWIGPTSSEVDECATFGFNLFNAVNDIRSGRIDAAFLGVADSSLNPMAMEPYARRAMASNRVLQKWADGVTDERIRREMIGEGNEFLYRRPSSPLSNRRLGFAEEEGSAMMVLFSLAAAKRLGISPLGMFGAVVKDSDGPKFTDTETGQGSRLSFGEALYVASKEVPRETLQNKTLVLLHDASTKEGSPAEVEIVHTQAKAHDIKLPVMAPKSEYGHGLSLSGVDEVSVALTAMDEGVFPATANLKILGRDPALPDQHIEYLEESRKGPVDVTLAHEMGFNGKNVTKVVYSRKMAEVHMMETTPAEERQALRVRMADTKKRRAESKDAWRRGKPVLEYGALRLDPTTHDISVTTDAMNIKGFGRFPYYGSAPKPPSDGE